MVEWGMSPHQTLRAGTIISAKVLGTASLTGSIETGKLADLVAFHANPLDDMGTVKRPEFVMKQGARIF